MNARLLAEMINLAVKKAVREELKTFKTQIISEIRNSKPTNQPDQSMRPSQGSNSLVENQKRFRENYQVQPRQPNRRLANDPMLNELLQHTDPVPAEEAGYMGMIETEVGEINVPTSESGRPITSAPTAVIEAMNRDYSGMFPKEEKTVRPTNGQVNSNLRNAIVSRMEGINEGFDNYEDDEEDFSFLDQIS